MLNKFFNPKSIAIVGASNKKDSLGYGITRNLIKEKKSLRLLPVNPKYEKVFGKKCYKSPADIKEKVDLAIIIIPAKIVNSVVEQGASVGIKNYIIISAGFKETGTEGAELENTLKNLIEQNNLNVLGPNCLGYIDSHTKINASFAAGMIKKGRIGFMSQSGAICTAMLDYSYLAEIGFSKFVSLGNKAGIDEVEMLKYFEKDKNTEYIIAYLESIARGQEFIDIAQKVVKNKPIFVLMGGISKKGSKAARSHTGALTSSSDVLKAAFKKAGIVQIESLGDLFGLVKYLNKQPVLKGNRIAIVANAGGPSVLTVDMIEESSLAMAKFTNNTLANLKKVLPAASAINNPVDLIGDADAQRYKLGLELVLSDKRVDGAIVLLTPQTVTQPKETARMIVGSNQKHNKPIITDFIGGKELEKAKKILEKSGIANYDFPGLGVKVLDYIWQSQLAKKAKTEKPALSSVAKPKWLKIQDVLRCSRGQVDFLQSIEILKSYGMPFVDVSYVKDIKSIKFINKYPVVAKVYSDKVIHKTDVGGIITDIKNEKELKAAFSKMKKIKGFKGILVQQAVSGNEAVIGIRRDPNFGPSIMYGLGGIYVNILKDVNFAIGPITKAEAINLIKGVKSYKILEGARGKKKADINALAGTIVKLCQLAMDYPQIQEIDLNPVFIDSKGVKLVDVRILV